MDLEIATEGGASPVPDTRGCVEVNMNPAVPPDVLSLARRLFWVYSNLIRLHFYHYNNTDLWFYDIYHGT